MTRSLPRPGRLLVLLVVAAAGCGRGPAMVEVTGTVTLNGKPLENVEVQFLPISEKGTQGSRSIGVTNAQGQFTLTCDNGKPGAVVGHHKVAVRDLRTYGGVYKPARERESEELRNPNDPARKPRFAAHYADPLKTPLEREVSAEKKTVELAVTAQ